MPHLLVIFIAAIAAAHGLPQQRLHLLPANTPGGRCMDGTPSGYYISENADQLDSTLWVIFMQGGGACWTKDNCLSRLTSTLGSSYYFQQTRNPASNRLQSPDCAQNPVFCNATMVYVPYCSSDTHLGNRTANGTDTWGLYFNGHSSFAHYVEQLKANHGLKNAKNVLLTGNSAGGAGTFGNVDFLAEELTAAMVKGAPNAGWFFPGSLATDQPSLPQIPPSDWAHWVKNESGGVLKDALTISHSLWAPIASPRCISGQMAEGKDPLACGSVHVAYPYIQSSVFVVENQYDTNQIYTQEGVPKNGPHDATWQSYVAMYGSAMRQSTQQVLDLPSKAADGLYLPSCLQHGVSDTADNLAPLQGLQWPELVSDWFFGPGPLSDKYRMVEECAPSSDGLPCNPKADCQVPSPSPPSPSPSSCLDQLKRDCLASIEAGIDCLTCAQSHLYDLEGHGCTLSTVDQYCEYAPCLVAMVQDGCAATGAREWEEDLFMFIDGVPSHGREAIDPTECKACADAHEADLDKAGCTQPAINTICKSTVAESHVSESSS